MADIINGPEFPSNSRRSKLGEEIVSKSEPPQLPKAVTKVVTGTITKKKKSWMDKFSESFFGDDAKTVSEYVVWDVLIPAAANTISEMISTGIDMLHFGGRKDSSIRRDRSRSVIGYNSIYSGRDRDRRDRFDRDRDRDREPRNRSLYAFDEIIISDKREAEMVLSSLVELIENYDIATVADFYDLVGVTTEFTDNKYGWSNLRNASVDRVRDGYRVNLPRPIVLD